LPQRTFPISEAIEAVRHVQQARHIGKVVLPMRDARLRSLLPRMNRSPSAPMPPT
jgi:hypothetical protein